MLFALFVGAGNHLYALCSICHDPIHTGVGEHHECCSCKEHITDCSNHTSAFDHKCDSVEFALSEFVPSVESRVSSYSVALLYRIVEDDNAIQHSVFEQFSWIYALFDDHIIRGFDPSTGALRAPPVLG